jgi:hypothetical protein
MYENEVTDAQLRRHHRESVGHSRQDLGVYFAHGQVVIEGFVEIQSGAVVNPWVAIGPRYRETNEATLES